MMPVQDLVLPHLGRVRNERQKGYRPVRLMCVRSFSLNSGCMTFEFRG